MNTNELDAIVRSVLTAILRRPFPVGVDVVRSETHGWDSLKHAEIVFAIEEELGIEYPEATLGELDRASRFVSEAARILESSGR